MSAPSPFCSDFVDHYLKLDQQLDLHQLLPGRDCNSGTSALCPIPGVKEVFRKKRSVPLPQELKNEMKNDSYQWGFMGIIPELSYLWATFDSNLFLFSESGEYVTYTDLDQVIIAVSVVKPKPNVFVEDVQHVLVLATPVEIILLAIVVANGKISLLPTNLSVPSDSVNMLKITGLDNGRIFTCGKDGNLYEIGYQANDSWFRKKCWKINHTQTFISSCVPSFLKISGEDPLIDCVYDPHRQLIYTLSASSAVRVFDLGDDGSELVCKGAITNMPNACLKLWTDTKVEKSDVFTLKAISVVGVSESSAIHLMGVTASGIRLYFSVVQRRERKRLEEGDRDAKLFREIGPSTLELVHIRTPPPRDESHQRQILLEYSQVDTLCYSQGACVISNNSDDNNILLICIAPAVPMHQHGQFKERVSFLEIETEFAWAIEDLHPESARNNYCGNELATQHTVRAPEFLCLTQDEIYRIVKLRPVDELYQLLAESNSQNLQTPELTEFFSYYRGEACAMCLMIICYHTETGNPDNPLKIEVPTSSEIGTKAESAFFTFGGDPNIKSATHGTTGVGFPPTINLSIKFQGISMYLSRILSPIWKQPAYCVNDARELSYSKKSKSKDTSTIACTIQPPVSHKKLSEIQDLLIRLRGFLVTRFQTLTPVVPKNQQTPMNTPLARRPRVPDGTKAQQQEEESLRNVYQLLDRSISALALIGYLSYPIRNSELDGKPLVLHVAEAALNDIINTKFQELVCTRSLPATNVLISALIQAYSDEAGNIENIASSLNDRCSSYFSLSSLKLHQVLEELKKLKSSSNAENILHASFGEIEKIAGDIDVSPVLHYFEEFGFWQGFVQLLLTRARKIDPNDLANQGAQDDKLSEEKREQRMECYKEIIRLFRSRSDNESRNKILETILRNDDKLCHYTFFMSYLELNNSDAESELLTINSPYLEEFLHQNDDKLLYRYYCIRRQFSEAAVVAHKLSKESKTLQERIDWLVDAAAAENAGGGGHPSGMDIHTIEEELDVAKIQLRIYNQIKSSDLAASEKKNALAQLDFKLMSLSELFNSFARPWRMWETQLIILDSAGYMDPTRVQDCWKHILERSTDANVLENTVCALARELYPSEWAFPVEFLCEELEKVNSKIISDISDPQYCWVINLMARIGVSFLTLFSIYDGMIKKAAKIDEKLCFIVPLTNLVEIWLQRQETLPESIPVSALTQSLQAYMDLLSRNVDDTSISVKARLQYLRSQINSLSTQDYHFG